MGIVPALVYGPMVAPRATEVLGDDDRAVVVDVGAGRLLKKAAAALIHVI